MSLKEIFQARQELQDVYYERNELLVEQDRMIGEIKRLEGITLEQDKTIQELMGERDEWMQKAEQYRIALNDTVKSLDIVRSELEHERIRANGKG